MVVFMKVNGELSIDTIVAIQYNSQQKMLMLQSSDRSYYGFKMDESTATQMMETIFNRGKLDLRKLDAISL